MGKAEQTRGTRHAGSKRRRDEKRRLARLRRQAERKDPENAPEQNRELTEGWVD